MEQYLKKTGEAFGPDEVIVLSDALERAVRALAIADHPVTEDLREAIAGFIVARARGGERDVSVLVDAAIVRFRL